MRTIGIILSLVLTVIGCREAAAQQDSSKNMKPQKALVVYYSWSGNTEAVAKKIQAETQADLFEIELQKPYPTDYSTCVEEYRADKRENRARPLKRKLENIADYDTVYLGSPIWSGTIALPVKTFLSEHDLSGKRVIPFVTHGGGGAGSSFSDMKKLAPRAEFSKGLSLYGSHSGFESDVKKWLEQTMNKNR